MSYYGSPAGGSGGSSSLPSPSLSSSSAFASSTLLTDPDTISPPPSMGGFDFNAVNNGTIAHAVLMSLACVFFFPLGAIVLRLASGKHLIKLHIAWQLTGLTILIAGFGLGLWIQKEDFIVFSDVHQVLGTVVVAFFLVQPIIGAINHYYFRQMGVKTMLGYAHVWLGRIFIMLGLITGGLGLRLADEQSKDMYIYEILAGVFGIVYIAVLGWWYVGRKGTKKVDPGRVETGEMASRVE